MYPFSRIFQTSWQYDGAHWRSGKLPQRIGIRVAFFVASALMIPAVTQVGGIAPEVVYAQGDGEDPALGGRSRDMQHNAGSCLHFHYLGEDGETELEANKCEIGNGGLPQACLITVDGKRLRGTCETMNNGTPSSNCICDTTKNKGQRAGIITMSNTVRTILQAADVAETTVGCGQLPTLLGVLGSAHSDVLALGPVNMGDVKVLGQVDYVLAAWPQVTNFATVCGVTFPFETVRTGVLNIKAGITSALGPS